MMTILRLIYEFFKTGLFAVGGGLPVLLWILWGILWPSAPRHRHRHHHRNFHTGSTDGDLV